MTKSTPASKEADIYPCDLCGLPVEVHDFELRTADGTKRFCCEGCFGIYSMLHEDEVLPPGTSGDTR